MNPSKRWIFLAGFCVCSRAMEGVIPSHLYGAPPDNSAANLTDRISNPTKPQEPAALELDIVHHKLSDTWLKDYNAIEAESLRQFGERLNTVEDGKLRREYDADIKLRSQRVELEESLISLQKSASSLKKDEFETTAQFERRGESLREHIGVMTKNVADLNRQIVKLDMVARLNQLLKQTRVPINLHVPATDFKFDADTMSFTVVLRLTADEVSEFSGSDPGEIALIPKEEKKNRLRFVISEQMATSVRLDVQKVRSIEWARALKSAIEEKGMRITGTAGVETIETETENSYLKSSLTGRVRQD